MLTHFWAWAVVRRATKVSMPRKRGGHTVETEMRPKTKDRNFFGV